MISAETLYAALKKALWRWTNLFVLLAILFVFWSAYLMITVNDEQDEMGYCVTAINRLNALEKSLRDLAQSLGDTPEEADRSAVLQAWNKQKIIYDSLRQQFTRTDPLYGRIIKHLNLADTLIGASHAWIEQQWMSAADFELKRQIAKIKKNLNNAIDHLKNGLTAVRNRSRELSIGLTEKWTQLNVLVVVSCFLAILTALLLTLYYNKQRAHEEMEARLKEAQDNLMRNKREQSRVLTKTISQISQIISKLNLVLDQQTRAMQEQSVALNQTSTTAQQIAITSQQSTQRAEMVAMNAENSAQITSNGKSSLDIARQALTEIHQNSRLTLDHFRYLSDKMNMIETITVTVKDISKKTNILALNASIEAFKAGDLGKGLAIVASEVRTLAERSQLSANEISDLVNEIQHAADNTLRSIESGYQTVEESLHQMNEAVHLIEKTLEMLSENDSYAKQILADHRQQAIGIDQLSQALGSINQAVKQIVQNTDQIKGTVDTARTLTRDLRAVLENGPSDEVMRGNETYAQV